MIERTFITVQNLDARAAALFVQNAGKFSSRIWIKTGNKTMNGKSMMGVISLSIFEGQEITVSAEGADAELAVDILTELLSK